MDELALVEALQALHAPWLDAVMVCVSFFGNAGIGWIVLGIVLCCLRTYRRVGIAVIVAVVAASVLSKLAIGEVVMRPRPCDVEPGVPLLVPRPFGSSFPSGHTSSAFAAVVVLLACRMPKGLVIPAAILAVTMAFSRLYLFVHYPTDVLAGAVLGALVGWAVVLAARKLRPPQPS